MNYSQEQAGKMLSDEQYMIWAEANGLHDKAIIAPERRGELKAPKESFCFLE